ncbi:MAG: hypothetical protein LH473_00045 [Chitinophagales bacterium]|nr:hypothetical protein [Chitinophagales bacterium]
MSTSKILLGVLAGAAAGAVLGIYFSSEHGAKTLNKLTDTAGGFIDDLKTKFTESIGSVSDKTEDAFDGAKGLIEKGKSKVENGYNQFKNGDHHDKIIPKADLKF